MLHSLPRNMLAVLGLGIAVAAALAAYGDVSQVATAVATFPKPLFLVVLGLVLLGYVLRFLRWQFYLRQIAVQNLSPWESGLIFGAGLAMTITPGKVGEWLKCYLLQNLTGTHFSRSAPVVVAERLTDAFALALLGSAGLFLFPAGWPVLAAVAAGGTVMLAAVWYRPLTEALFTAGERIPALKARLHHLRASYAATRIFLGPRNLMVAVTLGLASWGAECMAFWLVLQGLGLDGTPLLFVQAVFIQATVVLGGGLVTPGGLGVAEASIVGLCRALLGMPESLAVAAALLIRLCTLWFAVGLGILALFLLSRRTRFAAREESGAGGSGWPPPS